MGGNETSTIYSGESIRARMRRGETTPGRR